MSRKFFISVLVILTGFSLELLAQPQQPPDTLWTRTYGTNLLEEGYKVQQTTSSEFIIVGYSQLNNNSPADVYAIKIDRGGNLLWSLTYGGPTEEKGYDVGQTADSGYIIVGYYTTPVPAQKRVLLIKVDANGDTMWSRTYGGIFPSHYRGKYVLVTTVGDYLIAGESVYFAPWYIFFMKVAINGDSLWCHYYDGEEASGIKETSDSNYVIVGSKRYTGAPYSEVILLKVDQNGDLIWSHTYGGDLNDYGKGIDLTDDGGYIICGSTELTLNGRHNVLLIKTDSSGNLIWMRDFGGELEDERGYDIISVADGYIITGISKAVGANYDVYVAKADSVGNLVWEEFFGGEWYDYGYSLSQANGGYIICGSTTSFGAGSYDFYLIRLAPETVGVNQPAITLPTQYSLSAYPNPFNVSATITFSLPAAEDVKLTIYDITGQRVANLVDDRQSAGHHQVQFNASNLSSGLYFAQLAAGESKTIRKLLLVK